MTTAVFIQKVDPSGCPPEKRVYVGHPTCPRFLDESDWIAELPSPLTLVVPPLVPARFVQFERLFTLLQTKKRDFEVSANDWGTLYYVSTHGGIPVAGILLARQDTDPRLPGFLTGECHPPRFVYAPDGELESLRYGPPPDTLVSLWRTPSLPERALALLGVMRVELTAQALPLPDAFPFSQVTLYLGRVPLTVFPCGSCETCPEDAALSSWNGVFLRRQRNLVYYKEESNNIPMYVDRIVRY